LGGRDILPGDIETMFEMLKNAVENSGSVAPVNFIGLR
jgi:hypothetical protein